MKNLITVILITLFAVSSNNVMAQKAKKTEAIVIKTSTQCGMCKTRIEKAMAYEKGILSSNLNVEKAELTVIYKPSKTSPDKIREAISLVGYDADNVKANKKAYDNLPGCCKKGGMDH
ncbi:MAG: heavy-metal-associated domain-containing protein [Flavobacteriales bacterium]|nr:heavy-metal-associated domain-containing protein [Flavobacteriales bacterium]